MVQPHFSLDVQTNVAGEFLKLIDKHFPRNRNRTDRLERGINRHNIKISYSGTQSMVKIISSHNAKILNEKRAADDNRKTCNCQKGIESCPLEGNCQLSAIVYKATVKASDGEVKTYTGCTDRTFKKRHYGHMADSRNRDISGNTKLAGYIWEKKDEGIEIENVKWEVLKKCHK